MDSSLDMAEQQILGFYHAKTGFNFRDLIISMGLEKIEWEKLKADGMIEYLDSNYIDEIDEYFKI